MKFKNLFIAFCLITFCIAACKKSGGNDDPGTIKNDLIGTWHVKNYVAANSASGQPNDTLQARHNEVYVFTKDSLFTDSWVTLHDDFTVNPPEFRFTDTVEYKHAYAYTRNGNQYFIKSSTFSETVSIITLTSTNLTTDESLVTVTPQSLYKDLIINFEK